MDARKRLQVNRAPGMTMHNLYLDCHTRLSSCEVECVTQQMMASSLHSHSRWPSSTGTCEMDTCPVTSADALIVPFASLFHSSDRSKVVNRKKTLPTWEHRMTRCHLRWWIYREEMLPVASNEVDSNLWYLTCESDSNHTRTHLSIERLMRSSLSCDRQRYNYGQLNLCEYNCNLINIPFLLQLALVCGENHTYLIF